MTWIIWQLLYYKWASDFFTQLCKFSRSTCCLTEQ